MRVLVTGATGFLGRAVAGDLASAGWAVRGFGRRPEVCEQLAAAGMEVRRGDLVDRTAVVDACAGMDAVVHAGALSTPWGPRRAFLGANVHGTENVIAGCRRHAVSRLVFISSPSVTFTGADQHEIDETAPCARRFLCEYSRSKFLAEQQVRAAQSAGQATVILRPKAIFGPGDTALLPRLIRSAQAGRLRQFGTGTNCIDLTYVTNVVEAIRLSLTAERAVGRTYFITNGEHVPIWRLLRELLAALGLNTALPAMPVRKALALARFLEWCGVITGREPVLTRYTVAILARQQTYNIEAARRDLGYAPRVTVASGVEQTLAWWQAAGTA